MFFHRHTYSVDRIITNLINIIEDIDKSVSELQEDVAYLIEMLDERA